MIKKIILFSVLFCAQLCFGQNTIQFKVSKPYCIFNFLETAINYRNAASTTFQKYILTRTASDTTFKNICNDFKNLRLNYIYKREEFPASRRQYRSTYDLLVIALVNSNNLEEFRTKTIGILPNSEQKKLLNILTKTENYYNKLVWIDNEKKIYHQMQILDAYASKASAIFNTINHFYNSSWTKDVPFIVSLYLIPGSNGHSTATPYANSLCVSVFSDETNYIERLGIVLHEMCHVLYDEQPKEFQYQIEKYFDDNHSLYKQFAYNFFDEGLATALGNGWAYKNMKGVLDSKQWYNNEYINGYAKALFPLVEEYIDKNLQIDSQFVNKAVDLFAQKFPNAITDYGILLNRVAIYNDAETGSERSDLMNTISEYFQLSNTNFSSPIINKSSLDLIRNNSQTQIIIIDKNHEKNINELKKIFPQIPSHLQNIPEKSYNLSFYDKENRPVIILIGKDKTEIRPLLKAMKEQKYFDVNNPIQKIK